MQIVVELINLIGKSFTEYAFPMLVQSSVLIMILLAVDFLLHKKVRAVFRYWLWLLVLAKLILPPVLSFPVSIGRFVAAPVAAVTAVNKPFIEPHHFH